MARKTEPKLSKTQKAAYVAGVTGTIVGGVAGGLWGATKKTVSVTNKGRKKALAKACRSTGCPGCARCR